MTAILSPSAQGIAIFACAGANDFFEVGEFDAPINSQKECRTYYRCPKLLGFDV